MQGLEVHGLCAGYGETPVLHGVDLHVRAGGITAVLGASLIVLVTLSITAQPWAAASLAAAASSLARPAVCALFLTAAVICSMDAAVCSRLAAVSSLREPRSMLP